MNGGVVIVFDEAFGNQNGVFKVVAAPWHESDKDVAAKGQLAFLRARTIGQHLTFHNALAFSHNGLLVDAGILIGSLEFGQLINVGADFA